jgi:hypothetical protein
MADSTSSSPNEPWQQIPSQSAGVTDVVTQLQGIVRQLTQLVMAFKGRPVLGTFTMTATATLVIPQAAVQANSNISITPTNASAATQQAGATSLYVSSISPGVSFTVATASAGAGTAGATFSYTMNTPI